MVEILTNGFKTVAYRILELFIEEPQKGFSVREIARNLNLNHSTILNHIGILSKLDLVRKDTKSAYQSYYANTENKYYKFYKKNSIVMRIMESGLIEFLQSKCMPSCIALYGSCAKGDYTKDSDIDLFVESGKSDIALKSYEKALGRNIHILFEPRINSLSQGLRNNLTNGIILYGFLKLN